MRSKVRLIVAILFLFVPWCIRRRLLIGIFGYEIHPTARIGFSSIAVDKFKIGENSWIGQFNFIYNLDLFDIKRESVVGRSNWITGYPPRGKLAYYFHRPDRKSALLLGHGSAITNSHLFDCSDTIQIGDYSTLAGWGSQFLTHSIDLNENRQDCFPVVIGDYCFVGTDVVILGGSILPSYCVLAAMSLLNKTQTEEYVIYGGVPAKEIGTVSSDMKYFSRKDGFVG